MAKGYFGIFENQQEAQQALDQGKLFSPFVAMWEGALHYNDLEYIDAGSVDTEAYTGVQWEGAVAEVENIVAGSLFWVVTDDHSDWLSFDYGTDGEGDGSVAFDILENEGESDRTGYFKIRFCYDIDHEYVRNEVTVTVSQYGHVLVGYIEPASAETSYNSYNSSFQVVADRLYWEATSIPVWFNAMTAFSGYGTTQVVAMFSSNQGANREGTVNISFYLDENHTEFVNDATYTILQQGRNREVASFNEDYQATSMFVSSGSGSTNIYILNNPNSYYIKFVDGYGNEVTGTPATTAYTYSYPQVDSYETKSYSIAVRFCSSDYSQVYRTSYLSLVQEGDQSLSHAEADITVPVPASGGTGAINIYLSGDAVSWSLLTKSGDYVTFDDYPGTSEVTGNSSVSAVSFTIGRNYEYGRNAEFYASFYDQNGDQIGNTQQLYVYQAEAEQVGNAYFTDSQTDVYVVGGRWTGDVYVTVEPDAGYYYALTDDSGTTISTGSTSGSTVLTTITGPNLSGEYKETYFNCDFYADSALTELVNRKHLVLGQEPAAEEVCYDCAYVTETANQTLRIASNSSDYLEFVSAYINGVDVRNDIQYDNDGHFTYTFPSAGTHVLTLTRENDPYLQEWLQNTDMYSFSGHSQTENWGFHSNVFNGSNISSITLDEHCDQYSGDSFAGLPDLILINMHMADDSGFMGGSFPQVITDHPGTLHIPSGATSNYSNVIAALGQNWTVVDDL